MTWVLCLTEADSSPWEHETAQNLRHALVSGRFPNMGNAVAVVAAGSH